jgi:hypothetical protein
MRRNETVLPSTTSRRPSKLPDESEKALLHYLVDKKTFHNVTFKSVCDRRPEVFGSPASELRRQVQKRRAYLTKQPDVFQNALRTIIPQPEVDADQELIPDHHSSLSHSSLCSPPLLSRTIKQRDQPSPFFSPQSPPFLPMSHLEKKPSVHTKSIPGPSYQLYVDQFWLNPFGMFCVRGNEVQVDKSVVDKLTIYKPIFDMDDYDLLIYKASLTKGGVGITITEPTIPGYLWKNPSKIQALIDADHDKCSKSELTYKTIRMDMKENREHRSHDVTYYFPEDMTCNNRHFNGSKKNDGEKQELFTEMFVYELELGLDEEGNTITQFCPFVVWRMAINGEEKKTDDDDDGIRGTNKALARLGINVGEKTKTSGGTSEMDV